MFTKKTYAVLKESVIENLNGSEPLFLEEALSASDAETCISRWLQVIGSIPPMFLKKGRAVQEHVFMHRLAAGEKPNTFNGFILVGEQDGVKQRVPSTLFSYIGMGLPKILSRFNDGLSAEEFSSRAETVLWLPSGHFRPETPLSQDEYLKKLINEHSSGKGLYCYLTSHHIDKHYRVLSDVQSSGSCMTRQPSEYQKSRRDFDPEGSGISPRKAEDFMHPLEAYENSPNFRLALFTKKHHSEWTDEEYPFIARAIVTVDSEGKPYGSETVYGHEAVNPKKLKAFGFTNNNSGGIIRRIFDKAGRTLVPYADSRHGCSNRWDYPSRVERESSVLAEMGFGQLDLSNEEYLVCSNNLDLGDSMTTNWCGNYEHSRICILIRSSCVDTPVVLESMVMDGYEGWCRWACETASENARQYGCGEDDHEGQAYCDYSEEWYDEDDVVYCNHREQHIHDQHLTYSSHLEEWFFDEDDGEVWETCCYHNEPCYREQATFLDYCSEWASEDACDGHLEEFEFAGNSYYYQRDELGELLEYLDVTYCDGDNEYCFNDDTIYCEWLGETFSPETEMVETPDGQCEWVPAGRLEDWYENNSEWVKTEDTEKWMQWDDVHLLDLENCGEVLAYENIPEVEEVESDEAA